MKKYLLNYFIVGAMALLTVVGLQSFTANAVNKGQATTQTCTGDLVWYFVKTSSDELCEDFLTINYTELELHETDGKTALEDMEDFTFDQLTAESLTDCDELKEYSCAVGYDPNNGNFSDQVVLDHWVPTVAPICKICRD